MTITLSFPEGRPKRDIIELAFSDCGLASGMLDRTPEEQTDALRKLNALMMESPWNGLGYLQPLYGQGLPEESSGLDDQAINTVAQYLAMRLAPSIGVTLSPEFRATAARSLMNMQAQIATIPEVQLPGNTVRGAGRGRGGYYRRYPYTGRV